MVHITMQKSVESEPVMCDITCRYLYYILTNELYVDNPCPIMIAVNKSDLPECADHEKVYKDIEHALWGLRHKLRCRSDVVNNHRNTDGEKTSSLLAGNEVGNAGVRDN